MDVWELDKLWLFIVFTMPGFISLKVYEMVFATTERDWSKSIIEIISFSVLNFAALSWIIFPISQEGFRVSYPVLFYCSIALIFLVAPAAWPFAFRRLSSTRLFKRFFLSPYRQPWDYVFDKREAYWIVVHLKNGKKIQGKFGLDSQASGYPDQRQIYIQEVWKQNERGGFGKKKDRTKGILVFESEISYVEFFGK